MAQSKVTTREWRWVAIVSLVIMLATFLPYAVGWLTSTPEMRYGGFVYAHQDMHSYLAKMRYGARLVCGLLLLAVSYRFIAEFLPDMGQRRLAWTLVAVGGGMGWLTLLLFGTNWLGALPNEFYIPEGYTFLTLMLLPHLALARALMLVGWLALLWAVERESWRLAGLAGLAWLAMGVVVPFYVALVDALLAAWMAALWLRQRRLPLREGLLAAIPAALSGITLVYNVWVFTRDPVFQVWSQQNDLVSPHPLHYVAGYGLLALLAAWGLGPVWRGDPHRGTLLASWTLTVPLLVYLPINVQRRLAEGVILPLSILAVVGLARLSENWTSRRRKIAIGALLGLLLPSSIILTLGGGLSVIAPHWPIYHSEDELAAIAWLEDHAPHDSVVLSSFEQGNVLPAYADVRVYAGHGPETVDAWNKRAEVNAFFGSGMSNDERAALLEQSRALYVFAGPVEAESCDGSGCFDGEALGLEMVFEQGNYTVYEVVPQ
jgi:hypothetical protein